MFAFSPHPGRTRLSLERLEGRFAPAVFTVTTASPLNVPGSLIDSITQANSTPGADIIRFDPMVFGSGSGQQRGIRLQNALPNITDELRIEGLPDVRLFLERQTSPGTPEFRLFETNLGVGFTLQDLALRNGIAATGGAVLARGRLSIDGCLFEQNTATGGNTGGGAIAAFGGVLSIVDSLFLDNQSSAADGVGGAIFTFNTTFSIVSSTFAGNQGAFGSALLVEGAGPNVSAGLINCTFADNVATIVGTIYTLANGGTITLALTNCTVAHNLSSGSTAGVFNAGRNNASSVIFYRNSLFADNDGANLVNFVASNFTGTMTSLGNNLADDTDHLTHPTDLPNANPLIGFLADNGGMVPTIPLLPGSPALDAATVEAENFVDARGVSRPVDGVDIGAYEARSFTFVVTSGDNQSAQVQQSYAQTLQVRLQEGGENVNGAPITFGPANSGPGVFFDSSLTRATSTVVTSAGVADSEQPFAGTRAGLATVAATVGSAQVFFTLAITPGALGGYEIIPPASVDEGQPFLLRVRPVDAFGNLFPLDPGSVTFTSSDPGATLPAPFTFAGSEIDEGGFYSIDGFVLRTTGEQSITLSQTDSSLPATGTTFVHVLNVSPTITASGAEFVNAGSVYTGSGQVIDPGAGSLIVRVDYGDGSEIQALALAPDRSFVFNHVYQEEGSYIVRVSVDDGSGGQAATSFFSHVLLPGVPTDPANSGSVNPGQTLTVSTIGVSATYSASASNNDRSLIIVAVVPVVVAQELDNTFFVERKETISASYDVRAINVGKTDKILITFRYARAGTPTLTFFDRRTQQQIVIPTSEFTVDPETRTIRLLLDADSLPRLQDLGGTVFTIAVPVQAPLPVIDDPPAPPAPITLPVPIRTDLVQIAMQLDQKKKDSEIFNLLNIDGEGGLALGVVAAVTARKGSDLSALGSAPPGGGGAAPGDGDSANLENGPLRDLPVVPPVLIDLPGITLTPGGSEPSTPAERPPASEGSSTRTPPEESTKAQHTDDVFLAPDYEEPVSMWYPALLLATLLGAPCSVFSKEEEGIISRPAPAC
jgi:hypothetical protein